MIPPTGADAGDARASSPAQMRIPRQRLADLRAQRAANRVGALRLDRAAPSATASRRCAPGWPRSSPTPSAAPAPRLAELPDGSYEAEDVLEAAATARRRPALRRGDDRRRARCALDFSGSDDQVDGNLNCPLSVTKSAAFFAVRVLTDPDAPPSAGAHRPIEVVAPRGLRCSTPAPPAAVAAGNVETSSRVADLVIAALARRAPVPAQGQGTMNNLTLAGDDVHLLRDARRRPGRLPRRRRPQRDPRRDVEHPQHPGRGAGDRVPAARARALAATRQRRRGPPRAAARGSSARSKRWRRCASP